MKSVNYQNLFFIVVSWLVIVLAVLFAVYRWNYTERKIYRQNIEKVLEFTNEFYQLRESGPDYFTKICDSGFFNYVDLIHPDGTSIAVVDRSSQAPEEAAEMIGERTAVTGELIRYEILDIHFWLSSFPSETMKDRTFCINLKCYYKNTIQDEKIYIHVADKEKLEMTEYQLEYYPYGRSE